VKDYDGLLGISKKSEFFKNLFTGGFYESIISFHIGKDGAKSHLTYGGFGNDFMERPNDPPTYFKT
jgi:hypothetical protein